jgi:hypothetical protein
MDDENESLPSPDLRSESHAVVWCDVAPYLGRPPFFDGRGVGWLGGSAGTTCAQNGSVKAKAMLHIDEVARSA